MAWAAGHEAPRIRSSWPRGRRQRHSACHRARCGASRRPSRAATDGARKQWNARSSSGPVSRGRAHQLDERSKRRTSEKADAPRRRVHRTPRRARLPHAPLRRCRAFCATAPPPCDAPCSLRRPCPPRRSVLRPPRPPRESVASTPLPTGEMRVCFPFPLVATRDRAGSGDVDAAIARDRPHARISQTNPRVPARPAALGRAFARATIDANPFFVPTSAPSLTRSSIIDRSLLIRSPTPR